ncbi:MAG: tetratricopeptide repeat protein [Anaerolineales bacterium]|nr:tetratricopeptide repeat protein [Anaerolineales bacterium]
MAATLGINPGNPGGNEDAEYQQALEAFHLGRWDEAIRLLENLHARFPDDQRIERMLDDALQVRA